MTKPSPGGLSYGELLRLTEGHGTSEIYERATRALAEKDAELAEARDIIASLVELSRQAMRDANLDGGEYDADSELADAKLFLSRAPKYD